MAPTVTLPIKVDTRGLVRFADILLKHVTALRDDLAAANGDGPKPDDPVAPPQRPIVLWRNAFVDVGAIGHATTDPPIGVTIEITAAEWTPDQPWQRGHYNIHFVPIQAWPAELLDRAAELFSRAEPERRSTNWEERANDWLADFRKSR